MALDVAYYRSCAGITGWWHTPAEAADLFAQHECEGSLEEGFAYFAGASEGMRLVGTVVTPHPIASVPDEVRAELEKREQQLSAADS